MLVVMASVLILEALVEFLRLLSPTMNDLWQKWFRGLYRQKEVQRLSGLFYAMLAFTICVAFMEKKVAIPSMLFLSLGDAASALARMEFNEKAHPKSRISSLACLVVCVVVSIWFLPWPVSLAGSLTASVIERASGDWVDDNLVMPVGGGLVMTLMLGA